jgi:hypothetical protein
MKRLPCVNATEMQQNKRLVRLYCIENVVLSIRPLFMNRKGRVPHNKERLEVESIMPQKGIMYVVWLRQVW